MKLDFRTHWNVVQTVLSSKTYLLWFLVFLILYFGLNLWVNQFYEILPFFLSYRLSFVIPYFLFTLLIGIGIALNLTIMTYKLKQVMALKKEAGMTAVGAFGGMLGGACPGCFVGLLPTVAGVFGVTATLSSLPFLGFEIQVPTLIIVLVTLYIISNPLTCKIK
ncbi:hypothetical protein CMO88_03540 [Candidatus Woesearchaeota archaeon]|nr:hypothetical protein [Candidatus Woesearchaeota archaeon]|tara:strand:+ start:8331 stop:8822 length:492 start_codon:yes stop_codon:yes gene_type:complete